MLTGTDHGLGHPAEADPSLVTAAVAHDLIPVTDVISVEGGES